MAMDFSTMPEMVCLAFYTMTMPWIYLIRFWLRDLFMNLDCESREVREPREPMGDLESSTHSLA